MGSVIERPIVDRLTDDERQASRRGVQEMCDGKITSDKQVAAVFACYTT